MLLLTHGVPTFDKYSSEHLGRLLTPRACDNVDGMVERGLVWAADNDAFNDFNADAFVAMLGKLQGRPGCKFVTAPDVVGDAKATLELFAVWEPIIRAHGLPVALVLQDGQEFLRVPWERIDAVFVGGTTRWKLSKYAHRLVVEAKKRGLWVHMGRVNTRRRMDVARAWGCDSIDGTQFSRFRDTHLPWALDRLASPPQQMLEGVA